MRACGFYFLFYFFLYMISSTRMTTEGLGGGCRSVSVKMGEILR